MDEPEIRDRMRSGGPGQYGWAGPSPTFSEPALTGLAVLAMRYFSVPLTGGDAGSAAPSRLPCSGHWQNPT